MVSLDFVIDIILPVALWPCGHLPVPIVLKSGSLNLLETSGPVKACNGIAKTGRYDSIRKNVLWKIQQLHTIKESVGIADF
jgi:hypothetical protein